MKKRVFSILLALAMVASMLPISIFNVSAAETPIESFNVQIEKPVPGNHPSAEYTILDDANYTVTRVTWYDADKVKLSEEDTFAENGTYTAEVTFACNDGYVLPEGLGRVAKINGMDAGLSTWNNAAQTVTYTVKFFPERTVVTSDLKTMRDALEKDNESTTVIINDDINVAMDYTYYANKESFVTLNLSDAYIQKTLIINGDINVTAYASLLMKAFIENRGNGTLTVKGNGSLTVTFDENDPAKAGVDTSSRWQYKNILMLLGYKANRLIVEENVMFKTTNGDCIATGTGGYDIKGGIFDGPVDLKTHTRQSSISGGVFKENLYYRSSDDGAPEMLISGGTFEKGCTNIHAKNIAPGYGAVNKDGTEFVFPNDTSFTDYVRIIEMVVVEPAFVTQPHYEGQGTQMGTNYVSWKLNFTPVKLIARVNIGTTIRPNWKEYELDATKSFAALVAYSQKYVLYAYYGEGDRDYVASEAFSAEKPADFTPAFTKQPVGDQSLGGNPVEVTWATNFVPVKLQVLKYSQGYCTGSQNLDVNATTASVKAGDEYCIIRAYYSDTEYVTSNKFTITELTPVFTLQPADGVSLGGAYAETSWATNFTPVKLALVKINYAPNGRPLYTFEELDVNATYCTVEPGFEEYCIRAYFNDTQYVSSNKFIVTEMNYYNAWFYVDDTVLDKVMVLEGDYVERPADPIKDGYQFLGWYTDDGEAYNFAAPVTDDVHLTARFEEVEVVYHVVKFMVDDSEWYSCAVAEGEPVSAPTVPEKDGYKFLGWSYEGAYYEFKAPVFGDMILYAEYEKIVTGHTVAFHLGTDPVGWQEVQDGDTAEKPEDPAQEGKVFLGWYTAYEGGEKFDFSTPITADLNLYARFEDAPPVGGHIPGDVDGNGVVNVRDLGRLQQYLNGFDVTINEAAANVNGDSNINVRDLGLLQQYLNGFDVTLK